MKAEEKLDQEVDRLWQQMRYAYEHGGGHAGHLNNAWQCAMRLSKELRRLHADNERLKTACTKEFDSVQELDNRVTADEVLLRQALKCLERSDTLGWQANLPVIRAIKERLG